MIVPYDRDDKKKIKGPKRRSAGEEEFKEQEKHEGIEEA